jgi:hypothetical protein
MVQLDAFTRLLYIGLWTAADDHGAIKDELERIAMEVMPREDPLTVKLSIDQLIACGRLSRMINEDGSSYLVIDKWLDHQRVDKPAKSRIIHESSRKLAIPPESRRQVAIKYGCAPGEKKEVSCYFCGSSGVIYWPRLYSGKPSSWVSFSDLELDHFHPESSGGENSADNLVLSCRHCNRSRCNKSAFDFVTSRLFSNVREDSREFLVGKEGNGKERNRSKTTLSSEVEILADEVVPPNQPLKPVQPEFIPGFDEPVGKFSMHSAWRPSRDFRRRAAVWNRILDGPDPGYTDAELSRFVTYWQAEGKAFHHVQWEQKFADSVLYERHQAVNKKPQGAPNGKSNQTTNQHGGESRAMQKFRQATAERHGNDFVEAVAGHGRDLQRSVDSQERGDPYIDLVSDDWSSD